MATIFKKGAILSLLLNLLFISAKSQTTFNTRIDFYETTDLSTSLLVDSDTIYFPVLTQAPGVFNWHLSSLNKLSNNGTLIKGSTFQKPYYSTFPYDVDKVGNKFFVTNTMGDSTTVPFGSVQGGGAFFNKNLDSLEIKLFNDTVNFFYHSKAVVKNNKITILGSTDSTCGSIASGNYKFHLLQIDTSLNIIFQKTYGSTCVYRSAYSIDTTHSNGFIMCGYEDSPTSTTRVIKTDSLGNQLWTRNYGIINTTAPSILATRTSGYLIATNEIDSTYMSSFFWMTMKLYRIDENGDTLWTKTIGNKNMVFTPTSVKQLANDDFIISGTKGVPRYDVSGNLVSDQLHGFLCRTDSSGNIKWFNNYVGNYTNDSTAENFLMDVSPTSDGGFVASGWVTPTDTSTQDAWVIKVDSMGCLSPGCNGTVGINTIQLGFPEFNIYPNPANDFIDIETDFKNCYFSVLDVTGKLILREKIVQNKTRIELSNYSNGLYFIQLQSNEKILSKKFIKQ
jgi:hypothetical protein